MFSIKSRKCQEPPRTDKSQTPTNADLQSTYYSTLSTKLDTPRRTLPTIRGRRCSRRMAHSDLVSWGFGSSGTRGFRRCFAAFVSCFFCRFLDLDFVSLLSNLGRLFGLFFKHFSFIFTSLF